ncbi:hypothetical protein [Microbacterium tumbae]
MRKAWTAGALASALLALSAGCAPVACPAIGWVNAITVDASALGDAVFVQLCVEEACSPAPDAVDADSSPIMVTTGEDAWAFSLIDMTTPGEVSIRVYDLEGVLLRESDHDVRWTHSTEVCGGPSTAEPVVLTS